MLWGMAKLIKIILLVLVCATGAARAGCNITVPVAAPLTPSDTAAWTGCGTQGKGIQQALDRVAAQGGGAVQLSGPGTVLVQAPLSLGYKTTLHGDARRPWGMTLVPGAPPSCRTAEGFRHFNCPLVLVKHLSVAPEPTGRNATIWNLKFDGSQPQRPLTSPAVAVRHSAHVAIENTYVAAARYMAYEVFGSTDVDLRYVAAEFAHAPAAEVGSRGGAGVWIAGSQDVVVEYARLSAAAAYAGGYPRRPPWDTVENTRELIAIYGSDDTQVLNSTLMYTNTAAIYLAECPPPLCGQRRYNRNAVVANNSIQFTRQHGIDIAHSQEVKIRANRIRDAGHAGVALAAVKGAEMTANRIERTGNETAREPLESRGAILLKWGTSGVDVRGNDIEVRKTGKRGANRQKPVYMEEASQISVVKNQVRSG